MWATLGIAKDNSSFQSELWGLYSILLTLVCLIPASYQARFKLACDGQAALWQAFLTYQIDQSKPYADVV